MMENKEDNARNILYQKYSELFNFADELIKTALAILNGQQDNTLDRGITAFHFVRAIYLLDGIRILCEEGYAPEALVILRSFLNLYINIKWLTADDSTRRMQRYADFEVIFKKKSIDVLEKYGLSGNDRREEDRATQDKKFKNIMNKYKLNSNNWSELTQWSGESIFKMAKKVNLEREYDIVYSYLSDIEHTGPASVRRYLEKSKNGRTFIRCGPRDEDIPLVLWTALGYFLDVTDIVKGIFGVDLVDDQREKLKILHKKYFGK